MASPTRTLAGAISEEPAAPLSEQSDSIDLRGSSERKRYRREMNRQSSAVAATKASEEGIGLLRSEEKINRLSASRA